LTQEYSSHRDYMKKVKAAADARQALVEQALREAFADYIERREVEVVVLAKMDVLALASALDSHPIILKAVLSACNIAGRAVERDLGIRNLDTYTPRLREGDAPAIAGYIKPFLPDDLALPTICFLDRISFIDKEIRKGKGGWEKRILEAANRHGSPRVFKKAKFTVAGEQFELDVASKDKRGAIEIGIDVKRIEARRDIHKRSDEIVNKAAKLKKHRPKALFGVVVYYPFTDEHVNLQTRVQSRNIDGLVFANDQDDVIDTAVLLLLDKLGVKTHG
jgi:hypothetical protein